jgi:DNA-binding CsgD family transcriptional regulator
MQESEVLATLIGDIYDAALDTALWGAALGKTREFLGGYAAALYAKNAISKTCDVAYTDGRIDAHYTRLYLEKYARLDPSTTGQFLAEIGEPISTENLIAYDEFLETRFYKEWMRPQGLVDLASTILDKSPTVAAMFGVVRHERDGLVDDEMRRRLHLIVPHLRRAVLVGRVIDLKSAAASRFADTLDGISAGMFLVAASGAIVHANTSGHVLLASGDVLRAVNGRLVASDPAADQALQEILAAAANGDPAVGVRGIAQPLAAHPDGERYVAHVMPLTSGARRQAGKQYAAVALIIAHKVGFQMPSAPETIAKFFRLTPSELRVLLAIVQVGGVPETAEALGVAESTVKTHLRRLFDKTGSTRQADLVKLMAGFASPLSQFSP